MSEQTQLIINGIDISSATPPVWLFLYLDGLEGEVTRFGLGVGEATIVKMEAEDEILRDLLEFFPAENLLRYREREYPICPLFGELDQGRAHIVRMAATDAADLLNAITGWTRKYWKNHRVTEKLDLGAPLTAEDFFAKGDANG